MVWNIKFIKYRVCKYVQNVRHLHEHKHASAFAIGQLRHQSVSCLSHVKHAVDAVAAHRCHELWSHTHFAEWQTKAPDMWPPNPPDLNPVDYAIWSVIQLDAAGNILKVHYKSMKCDVSFSLGSISTLFRCGRHFLSCMCKTFLHVYNSAKIIKIDRDFQSYDHKCTATFFMVHNVYTVYQSLTDSNRFSLLHHFRHPTKHRSRHVNQSNHANPFLTYFHFRFPSKSMQIHFKHLTLFCYTVFYPYWPTHVKTPFFHGVIWYLENAHSDRFLTFTIEKVCFLQC